jgi:RecJ-like exonuclease
LAEANKEDPMDQPQVQYKIKMCSWCNNSGTDCITGKDCEDCRGTGFLIQGKDFDPNCSTDEYCAIVRKTIFKED